jgi:uncharacterized DUF497 family protein
LAADVKEGLLFRHIVNTICGVYIEFDPAKNAANIRDRGLPFELAKAFEFETATYREDTRRDYGEKRIRSIGYLARRLHVLVFVETLEGIRVISFRKANKREVKQYEQET